MDLSEDKAREKIFAFQRRQWRLLQALATEPLQQVVVRTVAQGLLLMTETGLRQRERRPLRRSRLQSQPLQQHKPGLQSQLDHPLIDKQLAVIHRQRRALGNPNRQKQHKRKMASDLEYKAKRDKGYKSYARARISSGDGLSGPSSSRKCEAIGSLDIHSSELQSAASARNCRSVFLAMIRYSRCSTSTVARTKVWVWRNTKLFSSDCCALC
mmetsp:Transcript_464/g.924  ORF Transcript_464/g.924 Transcript_464/m.924 type:complete len:212 (-) Transcript_464:1469-2104(-)